jgi:hypothetical protein
LRYAEMLHFLCVLTQMSCSVPVSVGKGGTSCVPCFLSSCVACRRQILPRTDRLRAFNFLGVCQVFTGSRLSVVRTADSGTPAKRAPASERTSPVSSSLPSASSCQGPGLFGHSRRRYLLWIFVSVHIIELYSQILWWVGGRSFGSRVCCCLFQVEADPGERPDTVPLRMYPSFPTELGLCKTVS